eukprot:4557286-Pyramimonas_sp.AAC.1
MQRTNRISDQAISDLSMEQLNAADASGSCSVGTSSVALLQPEIRVNIDSTSQDDSNDTNSFATSSGLRPSSDL